MIQLLFPLAIVLIFFFIVWLLNGNSCKNGGLHDWRRYGYMDSICIKCNKVRGFW